MTTPYDPEPTETAQAGGTGTVPARPSAGAGEERENRAFPVGGALAVAAHPTDKAVAMLAQGARFNWGWMATAFAAAFIFHITVGVGTNRLAQPKKLAERVEMAIYEIKPPEPPPPEPEPEKQPEPEPEKPKPKIVKKTPEKPPEPPPPSNTEPPPDEPEPVEPPPLVTGISMSSTTTANSGMKVRVGNTTYGDPSKEKFTDPNDVKAYRGGKARERKKEDKIARAVDVTTRAEPINMPKPRYPKQLIDEGVEGVVVVQVKVGSDGRVTAMKFVRKLHPALDRLTAQAIKESRWRPATINGKPVATVETYTYRWDITG